MLGGEALDEEEVLVGGLAADVAGLGLLEEEVPVFGGGVEGLPAFHGFGDVLEADPAAAFEADADLMLAVFPLFLPADVLAHGGGL